MTDIGGSTMAQQARAVEAARCDALLAGDRAALSRLLADDLVFVHSSGRVDTKASFMADLATGRLRYLRIQHREVEVRARESIVVLTGATEMSVEVGGGAKELRTRFSSVWVCRAPGEWQQILWHVTPLRDNAA